MHWQTRFLVAFTLAIVGVCEPVHAQTKARIEWDRRTLVLLQQGGGYGRMTRVVKGLLCCFEHRGRCYVRQSSDEGKTWRDPIEAASFAFGTAANPELLECDDGRVLLFYNQRPRDHVHPYSIRMAISQDNGNSWAIDPHVLSSAGLKEGEGCYEPSAIQLPSGEIQLFFANEFPHKADGTQEITLLRSADGGKTWSDPKAVSYRAGHRDGMPVPIGLLNQKGLAFAIEDNGITADREFKPTIIHTPTDWPKQAIGGESADRWAAVNTNWPAHVYAGAPYLRQMPTGETILSCQTSHDGQPAQMAVYIGDADAKHFASPSNPFPIEAQTRGMWNSLFVKNRDTITAISSTQIDGTTGVWAIDGHVLRK
jgi:hypothetical protein